MLPLSIAKLQIALAQSSASQVAGPGLKWSVTLYGGLVKPVKPYKVVEPIATKYVLITCTSRPQVVISGPFFRSSECEVHLVGRNSGTSVAWRKILTFRRRHCKYDYWIVLIDSEPTGSKYQPMILLEKNLANGKFWMKPVDRYHDLPSRNNSPLFEDQATLNIKTKRLAGFGGGGSKCVCIYKYIRDMCVRLPTYSVYMYDIHYMYMYIYILYMYTYMCMCMYVRMHGCKYMLYANELYIYILLYMYRLIIYTTTYIHCLVQTLELELWIFQEKTQLAPFFSILICLCRNIQY
jgi:hypothetical protein